MDRRRAAAALLALAACIACSAAAPTATNHTALELHDGPVEGCYYNFQHYGEGDRIMTNEPCLNCTCHNRMLMCYLRVCPFTKAIGQDCTVEKRADQCCPIVTCPDVPVDLLTSTSTSSPAEYGSTGVGKLDKYGCSIHGKYFPEGSKVPQTPNKPCEHCYCIRNMTTCVMQECTLHVDGCTPIYHKDVCCPVRYSCDHPEDEILLLDDMTTTVRPTPGFLLTTTTMSPVTQMSQDCVHDDQIFPDGALIKTAKACEHCYCMKGDIVCVVQECGTPMENEGKNCTSLPPRHGQCCPDTYICEGDERMTDSTTEIVELTSAPPRRVGVEGSGYRNEPDEPYTEMNLVTTEIEGSGEDFATVSQIDTGDNVTPEKETPEIIDEMLLTTESSLQLGQSTEPDKGQNTIPDSVDKETAQEAISDKVTVSSFGESTPTASEKSTTVIDLITQKDEISTTESIFRVDDDSVSDITSTPKEQEKATTDSTDLLGKTTFTDEHITHMSPTISELDQNAITTPTIEYTNKVPEISKQEETTTEVLVQSSVTEKHIYTDVSETLPEDKTSIESTTNPVTNQVVTESSSVDPNINEVDDNVSPISSPSRIPGEGDCLLNGITYTNNTSVPSTNNCHTGCKCISSIIKCDPIICSPPPEYMENMNDCEPVYDTPNSCCPTYVCSVKETIPPESHSHMSGTESPKPISGSECSGDDCIDVDKKPPIEPTICTSGNCLSDTTTVQKDCESNDCKDQIETSSLVPSQDCSDGKCQILPVESCYGENCKTETAKDTVSENDLETTKIPVIHEECKSDNCKVQAETSPSKPSEDCSDGKCQILPVVPCEGDNCKTETPKDTTPEKDLETTETPVIHKECESDGCRDQVQTSPSKPTEECADGKCQILPVVPCEGDNCKTETPKDTISEEDLETTEIPVIHKECKSDDCKEQAETSPSKPSEDCADGKCQILPVVPCEGDNCKTEIPKDTIPEKDLETTEVPVIHEECESDNCKEHAETSSSKPSEDCSDGKCQILPVVPCEGDNCKTETPKDTIPVKDLETTEIPVIHEECKSDDCKDQIHISPSKPTEDCSDGKCHILPVVPCEGDNCKTETPKDTIPEKDLETTEIPVIHEECKSDDCKDQVQTSPSKPSEDCSDGKCQTLPIVPCEGDNCKTETSKDTIAEKDLEPSLHDVPTKICNEENGCDENNIIGQDECGEENCRRKDFTGVGEKVPSECSGPECKLHDEPTVQSTEQAIEAVTEGSTASDINLQMTEKIESHITTTEETLLESDKDVTKYPIYKETPEKLYPTFEPIATESPKPYDTEKEILQTDIPLIQTGNEITEEIVTESSKLPIADTTVSQDSYSHTDERLTTKVDVHYTKPTEEIKTETSFTGENEQVSTNKPHIDTDLYGTVSSEEHTKLPEIAITESDIITETPKLTVTAKDRIQTESPVTGTFIEKEEIQTNPPEILESEKEKIPSETTEATFSVTEATQTTLPGIIITEKETMQSETLGAYTEKELLGTEVPEIVVTETFTVREDVQTNVPETYATEKGFSETETLKVTTATDKYTSHSEIPEIVVPVQEISPSESPESLGTEKKTIPTASPELTVTTKVTIETETDESVGTDIIHTESPDVKVTKKEDIHTDVTETATDKEIIKDSTPYQHEIKLESTTAHDIDLTSVEDQTVINLNPEIDDVESTHVTKESIPKTQITLTEKPDITGEDHEYDKSHEQKPIKSEDQPTEDVTEIATERLATYIPYETVTDHLETGFTNTEAIPDDTYAGVTELINKPTLSEEKGEMTTESHKLLAEEQEMITKSPEEVESKLEEKEVTTDKDLLYTLSPDRHETKSDDVSQIDQSVTESQVILTKEPEILSHSQYPETSTVHDAIVTEKYSESSFTDTESTLQPTHEITDEQEKHTQAPDSYPTISHSEDKTTKLPELYTTLSVDILTTEKRHDTPYIAPSSDLDKYEKDIPDKAHYTTVANTEEVTTTDSINFITVKPSVSAPEPQQETSTDQILDSESPHLTTKIEDKESESSTDSLDLVTEIIKTHSDYPVLIEEKEHDVTTKIPEQNIATETYKEPSSDNLTTKSTYKDELLTEQHATISQETSETKAVTDSYVEISSKTNVEDEKEVQYEKTTQSSDAITYTTKEGEKETLYDTEKDGLKPFTSDEKPSVVTAVSISEEPHLSEHTALDSSTTQTASQMSLEISTDKTLVIVEGADKNLEDPTETSTKVPEPITTFEESTLDIKDRVTTEPQISYTSSGDKLSTTLLDNIEIQKEHESENDGFFTTSSSLEPGDSKIVTEIPMSLVTHHAPSSQTTISDKGEMTEQVSIATVKPKLEEDKTQTILPETYDTEQKQSTETPDHHITQQEPETESSSKLNVEEPNNLGTDVVEKTTMSIIEDEYGVDRKTTATPEQQSDSFSDVPTAETVPDVYIQNTEGTPTLDTKEVIDDEQSQRTTTVSVLMEKEHDFSHDQETPLTESVDAIVTKSPHETQTILENITTPSVLLDDEHIVKESISTTTELQGTEYPEINVHATHTISPDKQTSESEEIAGSETPKISTEKESEIGTSVPIVSELTERPLPVVTDINVSDITVEYQKPTETVIQSEDRTTTYVNLEVVTDHGITYTHSKPLSDTTEKQFTITQQKESSTEESAKVTKVPDQLITSTESVSTELTELDEHHRITDSSDKETTAEDISSYSSTQIPEIGTSPSETQTESSGIEKITSIGETPSEEETLKPIVTVKEAEIQHDLFSTQSTVEKESSTTDGTADLSIETEKKVTDVHTPTELAPTTLVSSTTQSHKEVDLSEEKKQTTEPVPEFSETTPFLVELKEHTHQVIDESSRIPTEEIYTTALYEPQQTERGDQSLDVTDKYDDEYQTSLPVKVTELDHDQIEHKVPTTTSIIKDFTERFNDTETVSTTSSTYPVTDLHKQEKEHTTLAQDVVLTTSAAPETVSEKEIYTTLPTDVQKLTHPAVSTEEPLQSEASIGTTLLTEDIPKETSKTTTSKIVEETTSLPPITDKFTQPEEKPIKPTSSSPTQELTKPGFDDEINEGIPSPDFPPSGGYGQEPDYIEEDQAFGPGTCRYGGKVYVSAQQIPRDDPCDFCFCFRSDIICLQQSCPPPIHGCHEEPIQGFCCPRYECPVSMATTLNVTTTTTTTTTTLPPHFNPHAYKGAAQRRGCQIKGHTYKVGEVVRASSGPCLHCTCGGDGQMKCDPKACTPEPMLRQMIAAAVSAKRRR